MFRITVVGSLVYFFHEKVNFTLLYRSFDPALLIHVFTVQPVIVASILFFAFRFSCLMPPPRPPFYKIVKSLTLTMGLNNLLPGRISEFVKATYLKENAGISVFASLAAILIERIMDVLMLAVLTATCILTNMYPVSPRWGIALFTLLFCVTLVFIFKKQILNGIRQRLPLSVRLEAECAIRSLMNSYQNRYFYVAILCTIGGWFLSFLTVAIFLTLVGDMPTGGLGSFSVFVATVIGGTIPAIPGGFGTYEAGAVLVLAEFGIGFDKALATAIALHLSQILIYLLGTFIILASERIGVVQLARQFYSRMKAANRHE